MTDNDNDDDNDNRDVCFVVDGTGSMRAFLTSLLSTLPQLGLLVRVLGKRDARIAVLIYRDYDRQSGPHVTEFSGWDLDPTALAAFVAKQAPRGGGDAPEAAKTAARRLLSPECLTRPTTVIWYCDAAPHHRYTGSTPQHYNIERAALGPVGFDWLSICTDLAAANHRTHVFLSTDTPGVASFYALLAATTGGTAMYVKNPTADQIARHTVGLLLTLAGHPYDYEGRVRMLTPNVDGLAALAAAKAPDELDSHGLLPGAHTLRSIGQRDLGASEGDTVSAGTALSARFVADEAFRDRVYEVLNRILQPDMVAALTYNSAFGTLWRAVCRDRGDGRRDVLVGRMGSTLSSLRSPDDSAAAELVLAEKGLTTLLDASYDQSAEVAAMVANAAPSPTWLCWEPDTHDAPLTRTELLELSRSCHRGVVARVGRLLTSLRVVDAPALPVAGLPMSLGGTDLFAAMPHLAVPGMLFTRRPAALLAVIALVTGTSVLADRAEEMLSAIVGRWIDPTLPENLSADFADLVLRAPPHLLTEAERARHSRIRRLHALAATALTTVDVVTGYTSSKTVRPDRKRACITCHRHRSETLLDARGVCGPCIIDDRDYEGPLDSDQKRSTWCECRSCRVHYAVLRPDLLNVTPKCHGCRERGVPSPSVRCSWCANAVARAPPLPLSKGGEAEEYVCPPCEAQGSAIVQTTPVTIREYVALNGAACLGIADLDDAAAQELLAGRLKTTHPIWTTTIPPRSALDSEQPQATFDGRRVLNPDAIAAAVKEWIDRAEISGERQRGQCLLCFEDVPKEQLLPACGRRKCTALACGPCMDSWYGEVRPGRLCALPRLCCPFCKAIPAACTLRRHNREVLAILGLGTGRDAGAIAALDPAWHHGWCRSCYRVRPAVERACTDVDTPELRDFRCEECTTAAVDGGMRVSEGYQAVVTVKECPSCGTTVQKMFGCDHITCPCGAHWCWSCRYVGLANEGGDMASDVYAHMRREHGGYGWGEENDEQQYDSDYDSDD